METENKDTEPKDQSFLLYEKGSNLASLGRHQEALCIFDEALKIDPWDEYVIDAKISTLKFLNGDENVIKYLEGKMSVLKSEHYEEMYGDDDRAQAEIVRQLKIDNGEYESCLNEDNKSEEYYIEDENFENKREAFDRRWGSVEDFDK